MSILNFLRPTEINEIPQNHFAVVRPLDDAPEAKVDTASLGTMPITTGVKLSLMALRGYLVLMMLLVLYHVMASAGAFAQHWH
jgi:hypothetical protein